MAIGILIEIKVAATSLRTLADSLEAAANRASGAQVLALSAGCEVEATGKRPRETSPDGSERKAALEQLYIYIYWCHCVLLVAFLWDHLLFGGRWS